MNASGLRWALSGSVDEVVVSFDMTLTAACEIRVASAGPFPEGINMVRVWQFEDGVTEIGITEGHAGAYVQHGEADSRGLFGPNGLVSGNGMVAFGRMKEFPEGGRVRMDLVARELEGWENPATEGNALVVEWHCPDGLQIWSASSGGGFGSASSASIDGASNVGLGMPPPSREQVRVVQDGQWNWSLQEQGEWVIGGVHPGVAELRLEGPTALKATFDGSTGIEMHHSPAEAGDYRFYLDQECTMQESCIAFAAGWAWTGPFDVTVLETTG